MNEYKYTAYTRDKTIVNGKLKATSEAAAGQAVLEMGYHRILTLQSAESLQWLPKLTFGLKLHVVKQQEIARFSNDLSNLLSSGIILVTSLQLIKQHTTNKLLKNIITDIIDSIHNGSSFSGAILKHEDIFSETYYQVIKASEKSGNLQQGLKYLSDHIYKQIDTKKRLKKVFNYPVIVLTLAFFIGVFLVTNVLPTLIDMFTQMNVELPLITKIVIGFSTFLIDNIVNLLILLVVVGITGFLCLRTRKGKEYITRIILGIPVIKDLFLRINLLSYTHMTSMLIKAGLQLPNVTFYSTQTIKNSHIRHLLTQGRNLLLQGHSLSTALRSTGLFDAVSIEKLAIGERTGDIETAFFNISETYEKQFDDSVKAFIAIIEPAIIVTIAFVVGLLALSIITPMYSLAGSVG